MTSPAISVRTSPEIPWREVGVVLLSGSIGFSLGYVAYTALLGKHGLLHWGLSDWFGYALAIAFVLLWKRYGEWAIELKLDPSHTQHHAPAPMTRADWIQAVVLALALEGIIELIHAPIRHEVSTIIIAFLVPLFISIPVTLGWIIGSRQDKPYSALYGCLAGALSGLLIGIVLTIFSVVTATAVIPMDVAATTEAVNQLVEQNRTDFPQFSPQQSVDVAYREVLFITGVALTIGIIFDWGIVGLIGGVLIYCFKVRNPLPWLMLALAIYAVVALIVFGPMIGSETPSTAGDTMESHAEAHDASPPSDTPPASDHGSNHDEHDAHGEHAEHESHPMKDTPFTVYVSLTLRLLGWTAGLWLCPYTFRVLKPNAAASH